MEEASSTVPGALDEIKQRLEAGDKRMSSLEHQMAENTLLTRENTAVTVEIKEILEAARMGFKVLGGLGRALKWLAGVGAAVVALIALWHGNPPK